VDFNHEGAFRMLPKQRHFFGEFFLASKQVGIRKSTSLKIFISCAVTFNPLYPPRDSAVVDRLTLQDMP
jgi:hypothetical protein